MAISIPNDLANELRKLPENQRLMVIQNALNDLASKSCGSVKLPSLESGME